MRRRTPGKPILLTIDEVWETLRLPPDKPLNAMKKKLITLGVPYVKIGTDHMFEAGAFQDWFASCRRAPKKRNIVYASQLRALS